MQRTVRAGRAAFAETTLDVVVEVEMCGTNGTCATQELGGITGAPHTPTCTLYM